MSRDLEMFFDDILDCCAKIRRYVAGMSRDAFEADSRTYDAVIRNLEVMGEAVKHVPDDVRAQIVDIDLKKIAGMRDILSHDYFGIDNDIVWDVITNKLDPLEAAIRKYRAGSPPLTPPASSGPPPPP